MQNTEVAEATPINPSELQSIVTTIGQAVAQTAASQEAAARVQADASIRHAEIQASVKRDELASTDRHMVVSAWLTVGGLVFIGGLVGASFYVGRAEVATHALTAVGGAMGGWFAGKSKR